MLKHDHVHVHYFLAKNCSRSSSVWYGSQFLSHTYCMVPRRNWTKLRGLTLPLSDLLLVLCERILPDCFRAPDMCRKTILKALSIEPQFSQQFSWGTRQSWWCPNSDMNLVTFYRNDFEKKQVQSLDLPHSLVASGLIMEPNARGLHDLECYLVGQAVKMNGLTQTWGSPWYHSDTSGLTSNLSSYD